MHHHHMVDPSAAGPVVAPLKDKGRSGAVPVVGPGRRRRRHLAALVDSKRALALSISCAVVALFLYPGTVASSASASTSAVDGVLFACGVVLALESILRWHSGANEEYGARGAAQSLVELFCAATLGMDISFVAGKWAERQTQWEVLSGIRAARVIRVLRLWFLVQSWRRSADHSRKLQRRFPTAQALARKALDSSTLQAGALIIVAAVIAAPYLSFNGGLDQVESAVSAVQAAMSAAAAAGTAVPPAVLAAVFCDRGVGSGVEPRYVTTAAGVTAACPEGADPPPWRRHVVTVSSGGALFAFDVGGQQREEALGTVYLILFAIGAVVVLSVTLSESVGRQVVRPLEIVWSMLTLKSQEAYSALRHLGAFSGPEDDLTDSTERMVHQLSRMALCFKGLASESEGYLLEQYLGAHPDDVVDPATRQWLLGQAGHEMYGKEGSSGVGLNFVQGAPSGVRSGSAHAGLVSAIRQTSNMMGSQSSAAVRPTQRNSGLLTPVSITSGGSVNLRERESGATNATGATTCDGSGAAAGGVGRTVPSRNGSRETIIHAGQSLLGFLLGKDKGDDGRKGEDDGSQTHTPGLVTMLATSQGLGGSISQQPGPHRNRPPSVGHSGDLAASAAAANSGSDRDGGSCTSWGAGLGGKLPLIVTRPSGGKSRASAASLDWPPDPPDPRAGGHLEGEPPWAGPCRARDNNVRFLSPCHSAKITRLKSSSPPSRLSPSANPPLSGNRELGPGHLRLRPHGALQARLCHLREPRRHHLRLLLGDHAVGLRRRDVEPILRQLLVRVHDDGD